MGLTMVGKGTSDGQLVSISNDGKICAWNYAKFTGKASKKLVYKEESKAANKEDLEPHTIDFKEAET
jgi:hypothetical protein